MRTTWFYLIDTMAKQGKLVRMIEVAAADPEVPDYRPRLEDFLSGAPPISAMPRDTDGSWYKGADRDPSKAGEIHLQRLLRGRSRIMDIRLAAQVAEVARSVAHLDLVFQDGQGAYGTGFLIAPDLILTNHHNVTHEQHGNAKAIVADFDYVEGLTRHPLPVKDVPVAMNRDHDWAVIQLESAVDRSPIALGGTYTLANDGAVVIIQHPNNGSKKFALDALSIQYVDDNVIQYLADTQSGSSGSPVFNEGMQPIALHHAEKEAEIDVAGRKETTWRNEGINMRRVMDGLQAAGVPFQKNA
jgi:S1-C subfamily serine protease